MANPEEKTRHDVGILEARLRDIRRKGDLAEEARLCNRIACLYEQLGEWREAARFHLYDREISAATDDHDGQLLALHNLGRVIQSWGFPAEAIQHYYMEQVAYYQRLPPKEQRRLLARIHACLESIGRASLELAEKAGVPVILAERYREEALVAFQKCRGLVDQCQNLFDRRKEASGGDGGGGKMRLEVSQLRIQMLIAFGHAYRACGQLDRAKTHLEAALEECQRLSSNGDDAADSTKLLFSLYQAIGDLLGRGRGQWREAIENAYDLMLGMARRSEDPFLETEACKHLGIAYQRIRDFELAEHTLLLYKAKLVEQVSNPTVIDEADRHLESLRRESELFGRLEAVDPHDLERLWKLYNKLEYRQEEIATLQQILQNVTLEDRMVVTYSRLSLAYEAICDWPRAVYHAKQAYEHGLISVGREREFDRILRLLELDSHCGSLSAEETTALLANLTQSADPANANVQIRLLSISGLLAKRQGNLTAYENIRNECSGLLAASNLLTQEQATGKSVNIGKELERLKGLSYFGERKPTKTLMKLMAGDFRLKARTQKRSGLVRRPNTASGSVRKRRKAVLVESSSDQEELEELSAEEGLRHLSTPPILDVFDDENDPPNTMLSPPSTAISVQTKPQQIKSSVRRVFVQVGERTLLIPIVEKDPDEPKLTVSWLIETVMDRLQHETDHFPNGRRPIITGLERGVRLESTDKLFHLLSEDESTSHLTAIIGSWKRASLEEEYLRLCQDEWDCSVNEVVCEILREASKRENGMIELNLSSLAQSDYQMIAHLLKDRPEDSFFLNFSGSLLLEPSLKVFSSIPLGLDLSYTDVTFESLNHPGLLSRLEELVLNYCPKMDVGRLLKFIGKASNELRHLHLSSAVFDETSRGLVANLHNLPKLQHLDLSFSLHFDKLLFCREIANLLANSISIRRLHLAGIGMDDECLDIICKEGLGNNYSLQLLDLTMNFDGRKDSAVVDLLSKVRLLNPRSRLEVFLL